MTFGTTLRRERTLKRMPQDELADLSGVSQPTISSWESDTTQPNVGEVKRLAKALSISAATLLDENSAMNVKQTKNEQAIVNQYNYDSERKVWEALDKSRQETIAAQQDVIEALKLALGLQSTI